MAVPPACSPAPHSHDHSHEHSHGEHESCGECGHSHGPNEPHAHSHSHEHGHSHAEHRCGHACARGCSAGCCCGELTRPARACHAPAPRDALARARLRTTRSHDHDHGHAHAHDHSHAHSHGTSSEFKDAAGEVKVFHDDKVSSVAIRLDGSMDLDKVGLTHKKSTSNSFQRMKWGRTLGCPRRLCVNGNTRGDGAAQGVVMTLMSCARAWVILQVCYLAACAHADQLRAWAAAGDAV